MHNYMTFCIESERSSREHRNGWCERKKEIVGFTVTHKERLSSMCRNAKTGLGKSLRRFQ